MWKDLPVLCPYVDVESLSACLGSPVHGSFSSFPCSQNCSEKSFIRRKLCLMQGLQTVALEPNPLTCQFCKCSCTGTQPHPSFMHPPRLLSRQVTVLNSCRRDPGSTSLKYFLSVSEQKRFVASWSQGLFGLETSCFSPEWVSGQRMWFGKEMRLGAVLTAGISRLLGTQTVNLW